MTLPYIPSRPTLPLLGLASPPALFALSPIGLHRTLCLLRLSMHMSILIRLLLLVLSAMARHAGSCLSARLARAIYVHAIVSTGFGCWAGDGDNSRSSSGGLLAPMPGLAGY